MLTSINKYVLKHVYLSEGEISLFNFPLEFKKVSKKTILLHEGDVCNFEIYINKGCIRNYYIDENGFEVILHFVIEDWG